MEPRCVVVETTCDGCGKRAQGDPEDWLHFSSSHGDWGNDSIESVEHHDACSAACFLTIVARIVDDYHVGDYGPPTLEVADFNWQFLTGLLEASGVESALGGRTVTIDSITAQVTRLDLNPDDTVLVTCDHRLSREHAEHIRETLKAELPQGARAIVLDAGMTLEKLTDEQRQRLLEGMAP